MIDILLASYNGEDYIDKQIESIMKQSYSEFRLLVRDDGSMDSTLSIIEKYKEKNPDKIVIISDKSKFNGSANNFMTLARNASSDYIMFCDQDDVWLPDKVQDSLNEMKSLEAKFGEKTPLLVFGDYIVVDRNLEPIEVNKKKYQIAQYRLDLNHLLVQNYVTGCLMMTNKALYQNASVYQDGILMHDWWMALYASVFGKISHFEKQVMLYRQHGSNFVGAVNVKSFKYRVEKLLSPKTREMKQYYKKQAEVFYNMYKDELPNREKVILEEFIALYNEKSKIKRMCCLCKGRYLKSDMIRIIGQLIYI